MKAVPGRHGVPSRARQPPRHVTDGTLDLPARRPTLCPKRAVMVAWRAAGYYGVDRWLLPRLGTPWRPGTAFTGRSDSAGPAPA